MYNQAKVRVLITWILTMYFVNITNAFDQLFNLINKPIQPTEPSFGAEINIGSVEINDSKCDKAITPYLQECKDIYHEKLTNVALEFGNNFQTESVKKISCCGVWEAKQCAINAANKLKECGHNISSLYESLPSDPMIRADVFDRCSEYRENSAICKPHISSSMFSLHSLVYFIVITLSIMACVLIVFKVVNKQRQYNRRSNESYDHVTKEDNYTKDDIESNDNDENQ
ncbi:hypothetical protein DERP_010069 [Dermatophagoides pteronyssinus]|nr:hypothetical protein DERP_010069 [Dermatophagoides pteronyssinus]